MEQAICVYCKRRFEKYRSYQEYCSDKSCQRARKAKWQREALRKNPEYRAQQKQANIDWQENNPGYWRLYRKKNPQKVLRNKLLQRVRNQKFRGQIYQSKALGTVFNKLNLEDSLKLIAKMDVSKSNASVNLTDFWMIPLIAKMDAWKVNLSIIAADSK